MKIGIVPSYSITAYKQVSAFPKDKITTLGITDRTTEFHTSYDEFLLYCAQPSLTRIMVGTKDTLDLMVCHTEPIIPAVVAKEFGHKTVVVVSDLEMVRSLQPNPVEAKVLSQADGIVYANESFKDHVENKFGIKTTTNTTVGTLYVSKKDYCQPTTKQGGIVYQGSIIPPTADTRFGHRYYDKLLDTFGEFGLPVDIIPSPFSVVAGHLEFYKRKYGLRTKRFHLSLGSGWEVEKPLVKIHPSLSFRRMLEAAGEFHWGFMGIDYENSYLDRVMPHKVFDYMAAGVPMIAMNCSHAAEFIEKEGIGIAVKSVKEIKERYDEWEECQKNLLAVREKWAMENHIDKVINVFENAINGGK